MKKIFCIGSGILNLVVLAFIGIVCFYLSLGSVIKIQLTEVYYDLIEKSGVSVASKEYVEKYGVVDISQSGEVLFEEEILHYPDWKALNSGSGVMLSAASGTFHYNTFIFFKESLTANDYPPMYSSIAGGDKASECLLFAKNYLPTEMRSSPCLKVVVTDYIAFHKEQKDLFAHVLVNNVGPEKITVSHF